MNRILIGALSARDYKDRRQNCLETWVVAARAMGMDTRFLIGDSSLAQLQDDGTTLWLPVPDDYPSLPQKTQAFCAWALGRTDWDYLLKCDDDTAICASRLAEYDTAGKDYIGAEWRQGVDYGSGGAGYFLSRRAAEIVAERLRHTVGPEDLLVGDVLRAAGIHLFKDGRFVPFGTIAHRPALSNDLITAHAVGREVFEAIHRELDTPTS